LAHFVYIEQDIFYCDACGEVINGGRLSYHVCPSSATVLCPHCGYNINKDIIYVHIWERHKEKEIASTLVRMDSFLISIAKGFIIRYRIDDPEEDIAQYLRVSVLEILRSKYTPSNATNQVGDPPTDRFAKSCCSRFLKRYIQQYHYKKNMVNTKAIHIDSTDVLNKESYLCHNNHYEKAFIEEIRTTLTEHEEEIFDYIINEEECFTQAQIATFLNISQPMVSYRIKHIRRKINKLSL